MCLLQFFLNYALSQLRDFTLCHPLQLLWRKSRGIWHLLEMSTSRWLCKLHLCLSGKCTLRHRTSSVCTSLFHMEKSRQQLHKFHPTKNSEIDRKLEHFCEIGTSDRSRSEIVLSCKIFSSSVDEEILNCDAGASHGTTQLVRPWINTVRVICSTCYFAYVELLRS